MYFLQYARAVHIANNNLTVGGLLAHFACGFGVDFADCGVTVWYFEDRTNLLRPCKLRGDLPATWYAHEQEWHVWQRV
jgi:hypothetical protein